MAKFKVGDRVRIACPISDVNGREGTIWAVRRAPHRKWSEEAQLQGCRWWHTAYLVDVDGRGRRSGHFGWLGFPRWQLRPALRDPDAAEFVERMKKMAREPAPPKVTAK